MTTPAPADDHEPPVPLVPVPALWRKLSAPLRRRIAEDLAARWHAGGFDRDFDDRLTGRVAASVRFRPETVARSGSERRARLLLQSAHGLGAHLLHRLLVAWFVDGGGGATLAAVYDALGVPHDGTKIAHEVMTSPLDPGQVVSGLTQLVDRAGEEQEPLRLCLEVLGHACSPAWSPAVRAGLAAVRSHHDGDAPVLAPPGEVAPYGTADVDAAGVAESGTQHRPEDEAGPGGEGPTAPGGSTLVPGGPEAAEAFTTLDRLLVRTVVAALQGVQGAFSLDEVDDLVGEVVDLNDTRLMSRFHLGFLDALLDRPAASPGPGDNAPRRAAHLCGRLQGAMRQRGADGLLAAFDAVPAGEREELRLAGGGLAAETARVLVPALLDARRVDEAVRWLRETWRPAGRQDVELIARWARHALGAARADDARRVLEALEAHLRRLPDPRAAGEVGFQVRRRRAIAERHLGLAAAAEARLRALEAEARTPLQRGQLVTDLALVALGVRGLEGLALPDEPTQRAAFGAALAPHEPGLRAAAESGVPLASFLLALGALARGDTMSDEHAERLRRAVEDMTEDDLGFWEQTAVLPRARAVLALLELRRLDQGQVAAAASRLKAALDTPGALPRDLVDDGIRQALLADAPGSVGLASAFLRVHGPSVLDQDLTQALARAADPGARAALVDALEASPTGRTAAARFALLETALGGLVTAGDAALAERALDGLERLACEDGQAQALLRLLADERRWAGVWSRAEVRALRARLLEGQGRLDEAVAELVALAHAAISDEDEEAEELVARIRALGGAAADVDALERRLRAQGAQKPAPAPAGVPPLPRPIRLLFLGGNETQARYEQTLTAWLAREHPLVTVEFEFPGWGSNWGPLIERLGPTLARADGLVLMRFVRTQLGRTARALAGEHGIPWVACTGHGEQAIRRALERAIADVADRLR